MVINTRYYNNLDGSWLLNEVKVSVLYFKDFHDMQDQKYWLGKVVWEGQVKGSVTIDVDPPPEGETYLFRAIAQDGTYTQTDPYPYVDGMVVDLNMFPDWHKPTPEPEPKSDEEVKITKTEYDKLIKRIDEKEKFIQRQAQEVGIRRKSEEQLRAELFELQKTLELKWGEPIEATKIQNEIRDRETQLQDAENRTRVESTRNVVKAYVPEPESLMDEMVALLKEDGNPEDSIRTFRDNPYSQPPGTLVNLAKRAELRKEGRNKDEKIASLEAEIQTLKAKPQETVKKIEKALKESPAMSNDSGQASATKKSVDETQVQAMSDKELEQYLKENTS